MNAIGPSPAQRDLFQARMESLRDRFRTRSREDLAVMKAALDAADSELLRERSHRLAGVAATFGYSDIGEAARLLEHAVKQRSAANEVEAAADRLFGLLRLAATRPK